MLLPHNAMIVVADGAGARLLRNTAHEGEIKLEEQAAPNFVGISEAGGHHRSSSANPDRHTLSEDAHAGSLVQWLRSELLAGRIDRLVIIAPPRFLGEMRQHYTNELRAAIDGELAKEFVGHSVADIRAAVVAHR